MNDEERLKALLESRGKVRYIVDVDVYEFDLSPGEYQAHVTSVEVTEDGKVEVRLSV